MSEEAILRLSEIGRRLNLTAGAAHVPHLYFMTDSVRTPDPVQLAERLPRGTAVILRHYDTPDRYTLARHLKRVCQERALILIIAGTPVWRTSFQPMGYICQNGLLRARS